LVRSNITKYINQKLPFEYDKCLVALNSLQSKAWDISENPDVEERTKVQALSLAKECIISKLDLLTNTTVVDDAMKFVEKSKEKLISKEEENVDNESKEPDYDEDKE
jgi:hypothetical protein